MSLEESAVNFFKATKGFGTDEDLIIKEVCDHKNVERQEIKRIYLNKYKKRLEDALKSELSGNFLKGVLMLMTPSTNLEAQILHDAMKGLGTDKDLLIDFLCSKTGSELQTLTYAFQNLYGKTLKSWVKADTSGDLGNYWTNWPVASVMTIPKWMPSWLKRMLKLFIRRAKRDGALMKTDSLIF